MTLLLSSNDSPGTVTTVPLSASAQTPTRNGPGPGPGPGTRGPPSGLRPAGSRPHCVLTGRSGPSRPVPGGRCAHRLVCTLGGVTRRESTGQSESATGSDAAGRSGWRPAGTARAGHAGPGWSPAVRGRSFKLRGAGAAGVRSQDLVACFKS